MGSQGDPLGAVIYAKSVLENETHNLLWDFDIQMDH